MAEIRSEAQGADLVVIERRVEVGRSLLLANDVESAAQEERVRAIADQGIGEAGRKTFILRLGAQIAGVVDERLGFGPRAFEIEDHAIEADRQREARRRE